MVRLKDFADYIITNIESIIKDKTVPSYILYRVSNIEDITLKELIDILVEHHAEDIKKLQKLRLIDFGIVDLKEVLYEIYKEDLDKKINEL